MEEPTGAVTFTNQDMVDHMARLVQAGQHVHVWEERVAEYGVCGHRVVCLGCGLWQTEGGD